MISSRNRGQRLQSRIRALLAGGAFRKWEKLGFLLSASWVLATIAGVVFIGLRRVELGPLPPDYSMAIVTLASLLVFWGLNFLMLTSRGVGLHAFVLSLHTAGSGRLQTEAELAQFRAKLAASGSTAAVLAGVTGGVVGIVIAVGGNWRQSAPAHFQVIAFITTTLLIAATVVFIHVIDMCETAMNPGVAESMLRRIRTSVLAYNTAGVGLLLAGLFLGVCMVHPYLTVVSSLGYMGLALHYFFMWRAPHSPST